MTEANEPEFQTANELAEKRADDCRTCGQPSDHLEEVSDPHGGPVTASLCPTCREMFESLRRASEQDRCVSCGSEEATFYIEMEVESWPYTISDMLCSSCMEPSYAFVFLEQFDERAEKVEGMKQ